LPLEYVEIDLKIRSYSNFQECTVMVDFLTQSKCADLGRISTRFLGHYALDISPSVIEIRKTVWWKKIRKKNGGM
jgi:hypothetical protein